MARHSSALLAAVAVMATALLPAVAEARDRHGGAYYGGGYSRHHGGAYYDGGYRRRHSDDDNDALVAGVAGLVIGTVIGSAIASQPRQTYAPPPAYYPPPPPAYYPPPPPAYYPPPAYRASPPTCVLRERVWDPYAGQYVRVERRIPC
jgi:hypothetical protein